MLRRLALASLIAVVLWAPVPAPSSAQAPVVVPLAQTLVPGFNLVGWTQPAAAVESLFAALPEATAIYAWEAELGRFRVARVAGPSFLNDLERLEPGLGLWLEIAGERAVEWRREALVAPPAVALRAGLNLVAWSGPTAAPVQEISPSVVSALWGHEASSREFRVFRLGQPAFLNTLEHVQTGVGLWVEAEEPAIWEQGSPTAARVEAGSLRVDGRQRTWRLFIPGTLPLDAAATLVLGLHGGLGSGEQFAIDSGFDAQAESGGFLAVYPDGIANLLGIRTWNGGRCCGTAVEQEVDDVGFIAALVDELAARFRIDAGRVFAVGHSNGGILAYRLGCELADRFAAIGMVAGSLEAPCEPSRPVSVLSIHGDADESHPLEGGEGPRSIAGVAFTSVAASIATWVERNGCTPEPSEVVAGAVTTTTWTGCAAGVVVESQVIAGASHAWPGGAPTGPLPPDPSPDLDATAALWAFLSTQGRPAGGAIE